MKFRNKTAISKNEYLKQSRCMTSNYKIHSENMNYSNSELTNTYIRIQRNGNEFFL